MTLKYEGRKYRVRDHDDFNVRENASLTVHDVTLVRYEYAPGHWQSYTIHGETDLLRLCKIKGVPGEYNLELDGHELAINVGLAHFTPEQVDTMVAFLADQEYRLDMRSKGNETSRTYTALQDDIEAFLINWEEMRSVVEGIVQRPAQQLTTSLGEVGLQYRQRHNASTLALNLRTGRLNAEGLPTTESVYALEDQITLDVAENSHVAAVVQAYESRQTVLLERSRRQIQSLELEIKQETSYDSPEHKISHRKHLIAKMNQLKQALEGLESQPLPVEWRSFRHKPSRETNRARFDERYAQILDLEDRLWGNHIHKRPENALDLLQECGRRATWELYEYWVLAQMFALLNALEFDCEDPEGFQAFEDWQGASYGLRENKTLSFKHTSGLQVSLTYERNTPWHEAGEQKILKPDIVLEIKGMENTLPLVIDAKYKSYSLDHPKLKRDIEKSARRYSRALKGATSFLIHAGRDNWQAWPSRSRKGRALREPFLEEDLPFNHGIVSVYPGAPSSDIDDETRPLRKILIAWLVKNGVFWICFGCGANLKGSNTIRRYRLNGEQSLNINERHIGYTTADRNWPKFASYSCPCCQMTYMLTFCGSCAKGAAGHWEPIFKYVPQEVVGDIKTAVSNDNWSKAFEIHHISRNAKYLRHCAKCGSDYSSGEKRI